MLGLTGSTMTINWLVFAGLAASTTVYNSTFDTAPAGQLPAEWTATMTNAGAPPRWEVVKDRTAPTPPNVLAQTSGDKTDGRFPLAILNNLQFKDGEVSVRCKPVAGKEDRACGLVWRYRDENNYYLVRANALENNLVLYKVQNGKRTALIPKGMAKTAYGVHHPIPSNVWSLIKVVAKGPLFSVYFNHRQLLQVEDRTFSGPGKVGLWTKADSITYFDDFRVVER